MRNKQKRATSLKEQNLLIFGDLKKKKKALGSKVTMKFFQFPRWADIFHN